MRCSCLLVVKATDSKRCQVVVKLFTNSQTTKHLSNKRGHFKAVPWKTSTNDNILHGRMRVQHKVVIRSHLYHTQSSRPMANKLTNDTLKPRENECEIMYRVETSFENARFVFEPWQIFLDECRKNVDGVVIRTFCISRLRTTNVATSVQVHLHYSTLTLTLKL